MKNKILRTLLSLTVISLLVVLNTPAQTLKPGGAPMARDPAPMKPVPATTYAGNTRARDAEPDTTHECPAGSAGRTRFCRHQSSGDAHAPAARVHELIL
jgi:hypothetical protein